MKQTGTMDGARCLRNRKIRVRVLVFSVIYLIEIALFFWFYPHPVFTGDTGNYIASALHNQPNGFRPIGYSWFLEVLHAILPTTQFVVFVQYILLGVALLVFYVSVDRLLRLRNDISLGLAVVLAVCPGQLFMATFFMSDTLFIICTLLWLSTLFRMIRRPGYLLFIAHLILLFWIINIRYIGLFYPLITIGVLLYTYKRKSWLPALVIVLMVFGVYRFTIHGMKKYFGMPVFTEFSGWATANNASAMIPYINLKNEIFTNKRLFYINRIVSSFPDSMFRSKAVLETHFIWNPHYAGKAVLYTLLHNNPRLTYTQGWLAAGEWLGEYGRTLIMRHPIDFIHYFVLLNVTQVFYPDIGLGHYHHDPQTDKAALSYYGVDSSRFRARYDVYGNLLNRWASTFNLLLWIALLSLAGLSILKKRTFSGAPESPKIVVCVIIFLVLYLGGSVLTHPVHYRYLLPVHPLMLMLCAGFLNDLLTKKAANKSEKKRQHSHSGVQ